MCYSDHFDTKFMEKINIKLKENYKLIKHSGMSVRKLFIKKKKNQRCINNIDFCKKLNCEFARKRKWYRGLQTMILRASKKCEIKSRIQFTGYGKRFIKRDI